MKRTYHLFSFTPMLFLLFACSSNHNEDANLHSFQEAIPQANDVKLAEPTDASAEAHPQEAPVGVHLQDAAGGTNEQAKYYLFTRHIMDGVNYGTGEVLSFVGVIVHFPPSHLDASTATWGPWSDDLNPAEWRLRASRKSVGEYDYVLEGHPKGSSDTDYQEVLTGTGHSSESALYGQGTFKLNFDTANTLDPARWNAQNESGTITVRYSLLTTPSTISVQARPSKTPAWFDVTVTRTPGQGGTVDINAHDDVNDHKDTTLEDITVRSRWLATGTGRADVLVAGGDVPVSFGAIKASECWAPSPAFKRTFYSDNANLAPKHGDSSSCPFSDSSL